MGSSRLQSKRALKTRVIIIDLLQAAFMKPGHASLKFETKDRFQRVK
jgi:hypothetical protein